MRETGRNWIGLWACRSRSGSLPSSLRRELGEATFCRASNIGSSVTFFLFSFPLFFFTFFYFPFFLIFIVFSFLALYMVILCVKG